ncbi:GATA transcription factor 16-like [Mercurialis annua]|uniref:GATA transcription factor 16-like n=1 Tax=Mercurialis annua TaxID=3986 RepID=UPI002160DFAA|nr:GATA transcription factor 16-like [Mercurialis annua]
MMIFDLNTNVQEMNNSSGTSSSHCNELKKICVDCQTTRTPCWRSGPDGPKTLCNACGIRYRKKSRSGGGLEKRDQKNKKKIGKNRATNNNNNNLLVQNMWKRKLGEEEQAAFLLMALSYGCVSA